MALCKYILEYKGKEIVFDDGDPNYSVNEKLDDWLYEHRILLEEIGSDLDPIFSLEKSDPFRELQAQMAVVINGSESIDRKGLSGIKTNVTEMYKFFGLPTDWAKAVSPEYKREDYQAFMKKKLMEELKQENPSLSESELEKLFEERTKEDATFSDTKKISSDNAKASFGTAFHKIADFVMQDSPRTVESILTLISEGKEDDLKYFSKLGDNEREVLVRECYNELMKLKKELQDKFGKDAIFITEKTLVGVLGTRASQAFNYAYSKAKGSENSGKVKYAIGRFDLIVISRNNGTPSVHIIDYKTSSKAVGSKWHIQDNKYIQENDLYRSAKRNLISSQLASYRAVLRQRGIDAPIDLHVASFISSSYTDESGFIHVTSASLERPSDGSPLYDLHEDTYAANAELIFPNNSVHMKSTEIKEANRLLTELYGGAGLTEQVEMVKAEAKSYKEGKAKKLNLSVKQDKIQHNKGMTWKFWDDSVIGKAHWEYAKDELELEEKLERYVENVNKFRGKELEIFGESIKGLISSSDNRAAKEEKLDQYAETIGHRAKDHIVRLFAKYVMYGSKEWVLEGDASLWSNGYFIFRNGNRCEIVMVDTKFVDGKNYGVTGPTILGKNFPDGWKEDGRIILDARYGHLMQMKACAFIATHLDFFSKCKVAAIKATNLHADRTVDTYPPSVFIQNWNTIADRNVGLNLPTLNYEVFMDDSEALVEMARDALSLYRDVHFEAIEKIMFKRPSTTSYTEKELLSMIGIMKAVYPELRNDSKLSFSTVDPHIVEAYRDLNMAYLRIRRPNWGYRLEEDRGKIMDGKLRLDGLQVAPFGASSSANLRTLGEISQIISDKIGHRAQEIIRPWQQAVKKYYENHPDHSDFAGGEWKLYESWFERDETGELESTFRIKDVDDPSLWRNSEEQDLAKMFLRIIGEFRFKGNEKAIEEAKEDGTYYDVPLVYASIIEVGDHGGYFKGVINKLKEDCDIVRDALYSGAATEYRNKDATLNDPKSFNPFTDISLDEREQLLTSEGLDSFERNLDYVLCAVVAASLHSECSAEFIPFITALRVLMAYDANINKNDISNIREVADKFISNVIYNRTIIPNELRSVHKALKIITGIVSKTTLAISPKSTIREDISSFIRGTVHIKFEEYCKDIGVENYLKWLGVLHTRAWSDLGIDSLYAQLNATYRMANYAQSELAHSMHTNKDGLLNITSDDLMINTALPDFYHRMAVLLAKLDRIGALDAHSLDENGDLVYDFTKDKRWKILLDEDGKFRNASGLTGQELKAYREAKELYEISRERWAAEGYNIKEGEYLPLALDPIEQNNLQQQADNLFGCYDSERKNLIQKDFLGSLVFQFKTYGITRLYQWFHTGVLNIYHTEQATNEKGEKLYQKINTMEDLKENPDAKLIETKPESELTQEDLLSGEWRPKMISQVGTPHLGTFDAILGFAIAAVKGGDAWAKATEDRFVRANLIMAMIDCLVMTAVAVVIKDLYGDAADDMTGQDWWTRWSYAILMGAAQDGPIWSVINSVWGNGEIPSAAIVGQFFDTSISVITGKRDILSAMASTFGATREWGQVLKEAKQELN